MQRGRRDETLRFFRLLLELQPNHPEAQREVRTADARKEAEANKGASGLRGRFKR